MAAAVLQHFFLPATRPSFSNKHQTAAVSQPCLQLQWIQSMQQQRSCRHHTARSQHRPLVCKASLRPIEVSSSIAAARAAESSRSDALFKDPYAAALCSNGSSSSGSGNTELSSAAAAMDVVATRYIDESVENAMNATSTNSIQAGDFRQVVLLGDGFDTRPFRLNWPPGTLLFSVAPAEVHEQAEARLAAAQPPAHVMRGCLLRRVNMNLKPALAAAAAAAADAAGSNGSSNIEVSTSGSSAVEGSTGELLLQQEQPQVSLPTVFREQLSRAGFRGDRLSVWVLQGLQGQGLGPEVLRQLLAEVADCAAYHSLIVGELPGPLSRQDADNLLAEAGLLGAMYDYKTADGGQYKRWEETGGAEHTSSNSSSDGEGAKGADRWICAAQQLRLSLAQMGIYDEWSAEFEEADFGDDFIGNVS